MDSNIENTTPIPPFKVYRHLQHLRIWPSRVKLYSPQLYVRGKVGYIPDGKSEQHVRLLLHDGQLLVYVNLLPGMGADKAMELEIGHCIQLKFDILQDSSIDWYCSEIKGSEWEVKNALSSYKYKNLKYYGGAYYETADFVLVDTMDPFHPADQVHDCEVEGSFGKVPLEAQLSASSKEIEIELPGSIRSNRASGELLSNSDKKEAPRIETSVPIKAVFQQNSSARDVRKAEDFSAGFGKENIHTRKRKYANDQIFGNPAPQIRKPVSNYRTSCLPPMKRANSENASTTSRETTLPNRCAAIRVEEPVDDDIVLTGESDINSSATLLGDPVVIVEKNPRSPNTSDNAMQQIRPDSPSVERQAAPVASRGSPVDNAPATHQRFRIPRPSVSLQRQSTSDSEIVTNSNITQIHRSTVIVTGAAPPNRTRTAVTGSFERPSVGNRTNPSRQTSTSNIPYKVPIAVPCTVHTAPDLAKEKPSKPPPSNPLPALLGLGSSVQTRSTEVPAEPAHAPRPPLNMAPRLPAPTVEPISEACRTPSPPPASRSITELLPKNSPFPLLKLGQIPTLAVMPEWHAIRRVNVLGIVDEVRFNHFSRAGYKTDLLLYDGTNKCDIILSVFDRPTEVRVNRGDVVLIQGALVRKNIGGRSINIHERDIGMLKRRYGVEMFLIKNPICSEMQTLKSLMSTWDSICNRFPEEKKWAIVGENMNLNETLELVRDRWAELDGKPGTKGNEAGSDGTVKIV